MTSKRVDIVSILREDCNYRPRVVSYDDWSDVYHIIEFEKESDSLTKPSHQDDNGDRDGCAFIICLVIAVVLYYSFLRF